MSVKILGQFLLGLSPKARATVSGRSKLLCSVQLDPRITSRNFHNIISCTKKSSEFFLKAHCHDKRQRD